MSTHEMTGGEALARALLAHGAGPMFGMGGFQLLPFYDACRRLGLRHALINDERCGVFAADAYAKVTGRVGLADGTLGPGATNLVTGLIECLNAGSPVVAFVGDTHRAYSWKNMTQEARQLEILRPAVKDLLRVETIQRAPEMVRRAFAVATSGRPGPVVVSVPEDIAHGTHGFEESEFAADPRHQAAPAIRCRAAQDDLAKAVALLAKARRPLILAGGGVHISGAAPALEAFARASAIPVAHTMTGKGAIACTDPLSAGLFGRYDRIANALIAEADVLLVIGCKLGEIATKRYTVPAAGKTVIHMDIVAEEFGRTYRPEVLLWADARAGIEDLHEALRGEGKAGRADHVAEVAQRMAAWRAAAAARTGSAETPINVARILGELNAILPPEAILVADGGFAAHWGGLLYDTKRAGRGFVPDRGFASIGYGVPGAIGAKLGAPDRPVVAMTGDGGLNMSLGDLETARRMGLAFTAIVFNNAASGYVKALQHAMYGAGSYQSSDLAETDYAATARALGCNAIRVEDPAKLGAAIRAGIATRDVPTVLDVVVTRDPAHMLPAADNRTVQIKKGDRIA
ncbi:MAG: thiamine pyrophosphate-binding protein [Burkholderiales bacterium]|jgi:acetolactate synthase-1/2/3 large subunit|nr:thiamine pyrophosphate-binding protein [Burkholderiales bacterium]MCA3226942.1 thiamine pyrophosphate-binding protein [Burkholderiales bacterium]